MLIQVKLKKKKKKKKKKMWCRTKVTKYISEGSILTELERELPASWF